MLDAVSSLRGAAHAAPAPVTEYLASIHVSSSSSAAVQHLPAPTALLSSSRTCANALRKRLRRLRCWPSVARKGRSRQVSAARWILNKFLRNATDEHDTPFCLGPWRMPFSSHQTRGHLRDATDPEGTMVWMVYEMALFQLGLDISRPSLGCQPDALGSAYSGGRHASRTRVESAYVFKAIRIAVVQMFHLTERVSSFAAAADREVVLDTIELLCSCRTS